MENYIDNNSLKVLKLLNNRREPLSLEIIHENLRNSIEFLDTLGAIQFLLRIEFLYESMDRQANKKTYHISQQGIAYLDTQSRTLTNRIIDHVAFPLVVAFITALITTLVTLMLVKK